MLERLVLPVGNECCGCICRFLEGEKMNTWDQDYKQGVGMNDYRPEAKEPERANGIVDRVWRFIALLWGVL